MSNENPSLVPQVFNNGTMPSYTPPAPEQPQAPAAPAEQTAPEQPQAPAPAPAPEQPSAPMDANASIIQQLQAQNAALIQQNEQLNAQVVKMVQNGAQFNQQHTQPSYGNINTPTVQAQSTHVTQAQQLQAMGMQFEPPAGYETPSLSKVGDMSLESLASEIGKK